VSAVASHLVGTDIPLGVIPAGTLNHLARDVGVGPTSPRLCACWPAAIPCRWTWPGSMGASS
jgi:diacylglycerol kinase family enzyme